MPQSSSTSPWPPDAGRALLAIARDALETDLGLRRHRFAALRGTREGPEDGESTPPAAWLDRPGATFVTLTTGGALSGCIGSLEPRRPLREDVAGNARAAAFRDRRFAPLTAADLPDTRIEVSVLSPATPMPVRDEVDALGQLRPGTDGVILECGAQRATFLPQVWAKLPEPRVFLAHLRAKAGLPRDYWSDDIRLSRYAVTEFHEAPS